MSDMIMLGLVIWLAGLTYTVVLLQRQVYEINKERWESKPEPAFTGMITEEQIEAIKVRHGLGDHAKFSNDNCPLCRTKRSKG